MAIDSIDIADSVNSVEEALGQYNEVFQKVVLLGIWEDQTKFCEDQKFKDVEAWLSTRNNWEFHEGVRKNRVPNTGLWFVDHTKFRGWSSGAYKLLICHGLGMLFMV